MNNWDIFWISITLFQGATAFGCDIKDGYQHCCVAQLVSIIYVVIVAVLGIHQYITHSFSLYITEKFDSHLMGNVILATWLLGLFDVGWGIGWFTFCVACGGIIFRFFHPNSDYQKI